MNGKLHAFLASKSFRLASWTGCIFGLLYCAFLFVSFDVNSPWHFSGTEILGNLFLCVAIGILIGQIVARLRNLD
ncbi:hypothetical protein [Vibrio viridaestus]|uniref:hypothetical protein n=1 Tax=Vibrio viridaestus TaxID=2487322 RepID=UPI0011CFB3BB|nr:hypothetical protein [Vibrio viridaestus]